MGPCTKSSLFAKDTSKRILIFIVTILNAIRLQMGFLIVTNELESFVLVTLGWRLDHLYWHGDDEVTIPQLISPVTAKTARALQPIHCQIVVRADNI
jgi:hypothetical protein